MSLLLALALIAAVSCDSGNKKQQATAAPRPIPSPVEFAQQPLGNYKLGDPTVYGGRPFEPLPGASIDAGRLGGSIYQIEVPDHWNGRLVLHLQATGGPADPNLTVHPFGLRSYLIRNGFAWGTSSFSTQLAPPETFSQETAALWDFFVQRHGRPQWTYIAGEGSSGTATRIASIRYPDRFDGALTICGSSDGNPQGSFFVAGAFVAGVTQAEFDTTGISQLIDTRIRPALEDPTARKRFEDIVIDLSGGPRPFARESLEYAEDGLWLNAASQLGAGLVDNQDLKYQLSPDVGVSDEDFNRAVVRIRRGQPELLQRFEGATQDSYDLKVPLLTINNTGDPLYPISGDQMLRRNIMSAGKEDLLVQRSVRAAGFCDLADGEEVQGLAELVDWVEQGKKPEGEDLLKTDLSDIGRAFTLLPRLGSPEADAVPGADNRVTLHGTLTFDGRPGDQGLAVGAAVLAEGTLRTCSYGAFPSAKGSYRLTVAADAETRGCGRSGARVYLYLYSFGLTQSFISQEALDWPSGTNEAAFDGNFSSGHPIGAGVGSSPDDFFGTGLFGVVLDAAGAKMPPGTLVEAYIGETRCGVFALPAVSMPLGGIEESAYALQVSGPDLKAGCDRNGTITFRVDGKPVPQTAKNSLDAFGHELDLKVTD